MLLEEFMAEVKRLKPELSMKQILAVFGRQSHWDAVQLFYRSRHLDKVATGLNRHRKFVVWLFRNEGRVRKVIKRFQRERERRVKALDREIVDAKFNYEKHLCGLRLKQELLKEEPVWLNGAAA